MKKTNIEIREALERHGVKHWELAERRGISECKLCRMFRHEIGSEEKGMLLRLIGEIAAEKEADNN